MAQTATYLTRVISKCYLLVHNFLIIMRNYKALFPVTLVRMPRDLLHTEEISSNQRKHYIIRP